MSRLTNKKLVDLKYGEFLSISKEEYRKQVHEAPTYKEIYTKLGKLEDLEDDLGCPLDVVFKALKENYIIFKHVVGLNNPSINLETHKVLGLICIGGKFGLELCDGVFGDEFYVDTKDYGKTWWLKGETLV